MKKAIEKHAEAGSGKSSTKNRRPDYDCELHSRIMVTPLGKNRLRPVPRAFRFGENVITLSDNLMDWRGRVFTYAPHVALGTVRLRQGGTEDGSQPRYSSEAFGKPNDG